MSVITMTIMKKKTKKTRVGIFKNMGGNIPGGNFLGGIFPTGNLPGGSLIGGSFPGGSFPGTPAKIYLFKVNNRNTKKRKM